MLINGIGGFGGGAGAMPQDSRSRPLPQRSTHNGHQNGPKY